MATKPPSPKPMPTTTRPDRPYPFEQGMTSLGMKAGVTTTQGDCRINPGKPADEK